MFFSREAGFVRAPSQLSLLVTGFSLTSFSCHFFSGGNPLHGNNDQKEPAPWFLHTKKTHKEFTWFCRFRHPSTPHFEAKTLLETADLTNFVGKFVYKLFTNTRTHSIAGNHKRSPGFTTISRLHFQIKAMNPPVRRCLIKMNEKFQCFLPLATLLASRDDLKNILISLGRVVVLVVQSPVDAEKQ